MWQPTARVLVSLVILFAAFAMSNRPTAVSIAAPAPVPAGSSIGSADTAGGSRFAASLRHSGAELASSNISMTDLSGLDGDSLGNISDLYNKFAAALLTGIAALVVFGGVMLSQLLRRRAHAAIWAHGGTDA